MAWRTKNGDIVFRWRGIARASDKPKRKAHWSKAQRAAAGKRAKATWLRRKARALEARALEAQAAQEAPCHLICDSRRDCRFVERRVLGPNEQILIYDREWVRAMLAMTPKEAQAHARERRNKARAARVPAT